jgi:hypothetical protein
MWDFSKEKPACNALALHAGSYKERNRMRAMRTPALPPPSNANPRGFLSRGVRAKVREYSGGAK